MQNNNSYQKLADLIFPDITQTIEDLEKQFPPRNLKEGAMVTRFAPSPTGFLHTGSLLLQRYHGNLLHKVMVFFIFV